MGACFKKTLHLCAGRLTKQLPTTSTMILSQTPVSEIDAVLTRMYGGAPPMIRRPTLTLEAQEDRFDDPSVVPLPPPPEPAPDTLLLHQLPIDALRELFDHEANEAFKAAEAERERAEANERTPEREANDESSE